MEANQVSGIAVNAAVKGSYISRLSSQHCWRARTKRVEFGSYENGVCESTRRSCFLLLSMATYEI